MDGPRQTCKFRWPISSPSLREFWHRGLAWFLGPLLIGLAAVLLAKGSEYAAQLNKAMFSALPLLPFVVLPCGFALLAYVGTRFAPGTKGSGIPQTIAALEATVIVKDSTLLSARIAIGKALLTLAGVTIGASIGREGPMVQIGASIMHVFYGRGPFKSASQRRILILSGGAAGIAAAFNTPWRGSCSPLKS